MQSRTFLSTAPKVDFKPPAGAADGEQLRSAAHRHGDPPAEIRIGHYSTYLLSLDTAALGMLSWIRWWIIGPKTEPRAAQL